MPIYEYTCTVCNAHVEKMQRMTESPLTDCPVCGAHDSLKKLISQSSFHLKGSGWYVTDYKGKKAAPGTNGNGNGDGKSAPKSEGDDAEAKPAADSGKAETKPAADSGKSETKSVTK